MFASLRLIWKSVSRCDIAAWLASAVSITGGTPWALIPVCPAKAAAPLGPPRPGKSPSDEYG